MRFKHDEDDEYYNDDTVTCEGCERTISTNDDHGWEDNSLCYGCAARHTQEHAATLCELCKKPLKLEPYFYQEDSPDIQAHTTCVDKLTERKKEQWSDDFG